MDWAWNPWGVLGLVDILVEFSMAALVFFAAPWQRANRRLALFLLLQGSWIGLRNGIRFFMTEPGDALAALHTSSVALLAMGPAYLLFLATLSSPLVRPLKSRLAEAILWALMVLLPALRFFKRERFTLGVVPDDVIRWQPVPGPWVVFALLLTVILFAFGLVVAVTSYRASAEGTVARQKARAYAIAFGVTDALWLVYFIVGIKTILGGEPLLAMIPVAQLIPTLFVFLLGYAILKTQLFDIDLRIKWTIKRGTLVAIFAVVFLVATQLGQNYLNLRYGWVLGGVATGVLLFAIAPLQRAAQRLADATMPNVSRSPEYLAFRKLHVYRAAVESALEEGGIDHKERAILARMQEKLGIAPRDALAVESDVRELVAVQRPGRTRAGAA